jgi:hypothetical protein
VTAAGPHVHDEVAVASSDFDERPPAEDGPPTVVRYALVAVVIAPIAVAVVRALEDQWFPIGDSALLYLRARDVLTSHHPLLGSWTSASLTVGENMNNPGAMYDDLIAPTSRLLPFSSAAAIGVGALNALCVIGIAGAARAIGGWAMQRWALLAAAALAWIMGSELLIDIWQAHALLLPFLLYLVLMVGLASGQARWLPWVAAVASLLVQTHISYVYVLAVVTATALAIAVVTHWPVPWHRWRAALRSRLGVVTLVVLAACWAQPVWEQLFGAGEGNLARLLTNASGGAVKLGAGVATRFSAVVLAAPVWRLRSGFSTLIPPTATANGPHGTFIDVTKPLLGGAPAAALLVTVVVLLAGLALLTRRAGRPTVSAACWLAVGGVVGAPVALSLVTVGDLFAQHHVRWMWAFGAFLDVVVLWAVVELVVARWPRARTVGGLVPVVLTVVLAIAAIPFFAQRQGPVADYSAMPAARRVMRELGSLRSSAPLVYDTSNLRVFEPYSSTVMMRLQELGIEFRVTDPAMVRQLGDGRRADGSERTTIYQLQGWPALQHGGTDCVVAEASALTPASEDAARNAQRSIAEGIASGRLTVDVGRIDPARRPEVDAAIRGDVATAERLIQDASFDSPVVHGDPGLSARFALVRQWVDSTYVLYAHNPVDCPSR